jgi:hypothetical protein
MADLRRLICPARYSKIKGFDGLGYEDIASGIILPFGSTRPR